MNNDSMKKDFLKEIHDDVLNKGFITLSFSLILIIFMVITIEELRLFFNIIRFILCFICSTVMMLINVKYKTYRTEKQNKVILNNALFFTALAMTHAFNIITLIY